MTFTLPTSGTDPKVATKAGLEAAVNDALALAGISIIAETWAELSGISGTRNGQPASVAEGDTGTHTDPITGATVSNAAVYAWDQSNSAWSWVGHSNAAQTALDRVATGADVVSAGVAADRSEAARDAATVNADAFASVSAGLAAVVDGVQFQVISGDEIIRYERVDASTATEVSRYPTKGYVDEVAGTAITPAEIPEVARALRASIGPEDWASDRLVTMFRSHGGNEANRVQYYDAAGVQKTSGVIARIRGAGADLVSNGVGTTTRGSRGEPLPDPVTGSTANVSASYLNMDDGGAYDLSDDGGFSGRVLNQTGVAVVAKFAPVISNGEDIPLLASATGEMGVARTAAGNYIAYVQKVSGADVTRWESATFSPSPAAVSVREVVAIEFDGSASIDARVTGVYAGQPISFSLVSDDLDTTVLFDTGESLHVGSDVVDANTRDLDLFTLAAWANPKPQELEFAAEWAADVDRKTFLNEKRDPQFIPVEAFGPNGLPAANRAITRTGSENAGTAAYIPADPDAGLTIVDGAMPTIAAPADPNVSPWTTAVNDDLPHAWIASGRWVQDYRYPADPLRMVMVPATARVTGRDGSGNATGLERYAGLWESADGGVTATPVTVDTDGGTPYHAFEAGVDGSAVNNLVLPGRTFVQWIDYLPQPQKMWIGNEYNAEDWVDVRYVILTEETDGSDNRDAIFVTDQIEDPSRWFSVPVEIAPSGYARDDREFGNQTGAFNLEMTEAFWERKCIIWNKYDGYFYVVVRPNSYGWSSLNGRQREVRQHWIVRASQQGIDGLRRWDTKTAMPLTPRPNWAYHSYIISIVDIGEGCFAMVSSDYQSAHLTGTTSALTEPTGDASRYNRGQMSLWTCRALGQENFRLVNPLIVDTPASDWCSGFIHQGYIEPNNGRMFWYGMEGQHGSDAYIGPQNYLAGYVSIDMDALRGTGGRGAIPNMVADPEGTVVTRQSLPFYAGDYEFLQLVAATESMGSARVRLIDPETRETIPGYGYEGGGFIEGSVYDWRVVWGFEQRTKVAKASRWALPDRMVIAEIETRSVTGMGATKIAGLYARRKGNPT